MTQIIKEFGLRRTGTNLLSHLLEDNYDAQVRMNNNGWKHGALTPQLDGSPVVVMVKHPLPWLVSLWRYIQHHLMYEFITCFEDFVRWRGFAWHHEGECPAIHRWNFANGYWLRVAEGGAFEPGVLIVRFEDLLFEPENTCRRIAARFGLGRRKGPFKEPESFVGPHSGGRDHESILGYYRNGEWNAAYTPDLKQFVLDRIDHDILESLGYAVD